MVTQLLERERIQTTVSKAMALQRYADRVIQMGKEVRRGGAGGRASLQCGHNFTFDRLSLPACACGLCPGAEPRHTSHTDVNACRVCVVWSCASHQGTRSSYIAAKAIVRTDRELHKLFTQFALRYRDRPGGYTRVIKTGWRERDAVNMAYIE